MTQTDFLDIVDGPDHIPAVSGVVLRLASGSWQAEICGGGWVGVGSTRGGAIKSVTDQYHREEGLYNDD